MTAAALKVKATPMAPYIDLMQGLNREQKLAVVAFLVDTMQEDEVAHRQTDNEFVNELMALRYDGEMNANEMKMMLRNSHNFGGRDIKPLHNGE